MREELRLYSMLQETIKERANLAAFIISDGWLSHSFPAMGKIGVNARVRVGSVNVASVIAGGACTADSRVPPKTSVAFAPLRLCTFVIEESIKTT